MSVVDMEFLAIDFNPCPESDGNEGPNYFFSTARCKPSTVVSSLFSLAYSIDIIFALTECHCLYMYISITFCIADLSPNFALFVSRLYRIYHILQFLHCLHSATLIDVEDVAVSEFFVLKITSVLIFTLFTRNNFVSFCSRLSFLFPFSVYDIAHTHKLCTTKLKSTDAFQVDTSHTAEC